MKIFIIQSMGGDANLGGVAAEGLRIEIFPREAIKAITTREGYDRADNASDEELLKKLELGGVAETSWQYGDSYPMFPSLRATAIKLPDIPLELGCLVDVAQGSCPFLTPGGYSGECTLAIFRFDHNIGRDGE